MPALAEWYIQLTARGAQQANQEIDKTKEVLQRAEQRAQALERNLSRAFMGGTAAVLGFARAGLQGTGMGERLSVAFTQFAQQIASVLLPVFELLLDVLQAATSWFRKLGGEGQIAVLALGTAIVIAVAIATGGLSAILSAIVGVVSIFYKLVSATEGGQDTFSALRDVLERIGNAVMPIVNRAMQTFAALVDRLGPIIGNVLVKQLTDLAAILERVAGAIDKIDEKAQANPVLLGLLKGMPGGALMFGQGGGGKSNMARSDVQRSGGQFEDVAAAWKRLQGAALKQDDIPKKQLEQQTLTVEALKELNNRFARMGLPHAAAFVD